MSENDENRADEAINGIYSRFFDGVPACCRVINTSREDTDFRLAAIVTSATGEKRVIKLAANDFTFPDKILMWQRTVEEYRDLGYYCPRIFGDRSGGFPTVVYRGRECVAYAEEFSAYRPLEDRAAEGENSPSPDLAPYMKDIWSMTARVAAKRLDYTSYPSAYCLFETFCPSDSTDEVMENALEWKRTAFALPGEFAGKARGIWDAWLNNRAALKPLYSALPASVFQADLNPSNLLVDTDGRFVGVYDFNLCGRDVFINYLMRENFDAFEKEIRLIREALTVACGHYVFSDAEKRAALPLYRCLKPLWYSRVQELKDAKDDAAKIRRCLEQTEYYLKTDIDFAGYMG